MLQYILFQSISFKWRDLVASDDYNRTKIIGYIERLRIAFLFFFY